VIPGATTSGAATSAVRTTIGPADGTRIVRALRIAQPQAAQAAAAIAP
jgi:hypothetical protein